MGYGEIRWEYDITLLFRFAINSIQSANFQAAKKLKVFNRGFAQNKNASQFFHGLQGKRTGPTASSCHKI